MSALPKIGTLESIVLAKLMQNPEGVTYLDFPKDSQLHNEKKLDEIICNLRTGMYESDDDNLLKFDS
jgi:hypothetical protein